MSKLVKLCVLTTITLAVANGAGQAATDTSMVSTVANTPPTMTDVSNQVLFPNMSTAALAFGVGDAETQLTALVLTATSSNTSLVPNANVTFGGNGANRTVTVTPAANRVGTTTVTLTVTDGDGQNATDTFIVTVIIAQLPLRPSVGTTAGGTRVEVRGAFLTPASTVAFGGTSATAVEFVNDSTLIAYTPPGVPGDGAAVVTDGANSFTFNYRYVTPPSSSSTDTDADGMPDRWELIYSLDPQNPSDARADDDGDGVTNLAERQQDTHPRSFQRRFLAEGASSEFFDMRLALVNPTAFPATTLLRYLLGGGSALTEVQVVPPLTRVTVDPRARFGNTTAEFSTTVESDNQVIVDRTMTWDRASGYGAHAETAVEAPDTTWYLAEGSTVGGFNLFYLLQNPGAASAQVRVRFLRPVGAPLAKTYTLVPNSRTNIWVNVEDFPGLGKALASTDVSAVIESTNGQPIIVERAMYLNLPGQTFGAGHESAGVTAAATQWFLAEGATGAYFDLFVLVANPAAVDAHIEATYLLPNGTTIVKPYTVPANSRFNIWVDLQDARLAETAVSTTVRSTNGVPVIVERAMWWPGDSTQWHEAHNSPGATHTGTRWALAEGEVGGARGMDTYILLANTSVATGTVQVTLLFEDGTRLGRTFDVHGNSRFNVDVRSEFPAAVNRRFGALVESQGSTPAQLVVERAIYWDALGNTWSAGTNALGTRLQ